MALPDFVIIGAMKCGTSTLAAQLGAQPGVFMTTPKEPQFFSDDEVHARGLDWYASLFDGAGDRLKGEASTHYTKLPTYPHTVARMKRALPAPRLVYMVRDPLARAVSQYIHEWSEGRMSGDPARMFLRHPHLVDYGRYAMQIAPFVDAFGAEAICLTSLERLTGQPSAELARIGAHIGLRDRAVWHEDIAPQNVSTQRVRKFPLHDLLVTNPVATRLRRALVPASVRARIRQARSLGTRPELPDALVEDLRGIYAEDLGALAGLFPGVELGFEDAYRSVRAT
jgi:hypothetical protein